MESRDEFLLLVDAFHHERETHRRAAPGTHARSAAAARLRDLDAAFERRLRAWAADERLRQAWRKTLHHGAPAPHEPGPLPKVAFRGRSDAGSEAVAFAGADGMVDLHIDGTLARRLPSLALTTRGGHATLEIDGLPVFEERFAAPRAAREALDAWVSHPDGAPPWLHAAALVTDGLIDRHFALTPRGRRALAAGVPA